MITGDRAIAQINMRRALLNGICSAAPRSYRDTLRKTGGCSYMKGGPFENRMLRSSLMLRKMASPILKHNVSVFYSSCRRKIFSSCDLLFPFRFLCSKPISFVSSGPKCLKVSQNGPKWLFLSFSVFICLIFLLRMIMPRMWREPAPW